MSRKSIFIILFTMVISLVIVSIYSTFAYNEETAKLDESTADYNLLYAIRKSSENQIVVNAGETKFIDIVLENQYDAVVKYGMYYHLLSPNKMPEKVLIKGADESPNLLEDTIKKGDKKTITIKIDNGSDENINIVVGALIGFENGNIQELIKDGEVLIK